MRHWRALLTIGLCLTGMGEAVAQGVVLLDPRSDAVVVRSIDTGGSGPVLEVFSDPSAVQPLPAVVFVLGYPDDALSVGPLSATAHYRTWARLVAARGMTGVLYSTTSPENDLSSVMSFLATNGSDFGIDGTRIALWAASGNGPVAVSYLQDEDGVEVRAMAALYAVLPSGDGFMSEELETMSSRQGYVLPVPRPDDAMPTQVPVLVVRPGRDHPVLLQLMDHFAEWSAGEGAEIEVLGYPAGDHSFDSRQDSDASRDVIEEVLSFLRTELGAGMRELRGGSF